MQILRPTNSAFHFQAKSRPASPCPSVSSQPIFSLSAPLPSTSSSPPGQRPSHPHNCFTSPCIFCNLSPQWISPCYSEASLSMATLSNDLLQLQNSSRIHRMSFQTSSTFTKKHEAFVSLFFLTTAPTHFLSLLSTTLHSNTLPFLPQCS